MALLRSAGCDDRKMETVNFGVLAKGASLNSVSALVEALGALNQSPLAIPNTRMLNFDTLNPGKIVGRFQTMKAMAEQVAAVEG